MPLSAGPVSELRDSYKAAGPVSFLEPRNHEKEDLAVRYA